MTDGTERNRAAVLQLLQHVMSGDIGAAMELIHADYVEHNPVIGQGRAELRGYLQAIADHDPVPQIKIERVIAENDHVVIHLRTLWANARPSTTAIDIFRLRDGLIVEHWDVVQPTR